MKKVDFFIVGGAKCGTTWVHNLLAQREDVALPEQKETNYFAFLGKEVKFSGPHDDENTNKNTITNFDEYIALFDPRRSRWVEVCPSYLYVPESAANIHKYNPDAKILIILRNPADRAWSNYLYLAQYGGEDKTFEEAISLEPERKKRGWVYLWDIYSQGLYFEQVKRYIDLFGRQKVKVLLFEDIARDPVNFMREIESFFSLPPFDYQYNADKNESGVPLSGMQGIYRMIFAPGYVNKLGRLLLPTALRKKLSSIVRKKTTKKIVMHDNVRKKLMSDYSADINALSKLLATDFSIWGDRMIKKIQQDQVGQSK